MDNQGELQSLFDKVSKSLVDVTRTSAQLAASDVGFLRTSKPKVGKQLDKSNARLLQLTKKLLHSAVGGTTIRAPDLSNVDDVDDNWRGVVDVIDNLLEKTDLALDECTGAIKRNASEPERQLPTRADGRSSRYMNAVMPKPQLHFRRPPQNDNDAVFKPLLREKPHASVPLDESIQGEHPETSSKQYASLYSSIVQPCKVKSAVNQMLRYRHPYQTEIEEYQYPSFVYEKAEPIAFTSPETSEATFVDTLEGVQAMLAELTQAKEIAIDLEHHDKHSYIGLVSLMQISTRSKDWIVDTLKPWREDLQVLNEVFANPSILKVLHGSHMDIIWLQRDLGLYVVGLFDTFHASVALKYPGQGLAFLLNKFALFKAQKQYQLADWRVRPLPSDLLNYARSDTHYLLYIYDNMRNELVSESDALPPPDNLIAYVLAKSKDECLQRYEHQPYDIQQGTGRDGWYNMLIRTPALFTRPQFAVFKAVHEWRDSVARAEDESLPSVMAKQALFSIARAMPNDLPALYGCVQPMSEFIRSRVEELLSVVRKAKADGEHGPDMQATLAEHPETIAYEQRRAERHRLRKETQSRPLSVGEVLQRERALEGGEAQVQNVATDSSQFWGTISWQLMNGSIAAHTTLELQVPLPPAQNKTEASEAAYDDAVQETAHPGTSPATAIDPLQKPQTDPNGFETFTLRERAYNKKRKAATEDSNPDHPADATGAELSEALRAVQDEDEEMQDVDAGDSHAAKRARKVAKKADKAHKKAERERAQQALRDEKPFDYASAPSVLNAGVNSGGPEANAGTGKTGARPYAKSMNAPKGMPKVKKELKGKSMTFKG